VLALSNSIHIVRRYQGLRVKMDLPTALRKALADTTRPCTLASVTTAAGFASLAVATMAPIRELGVLAALGILISLMVNLTVVPLLIERLKVPPVRERSGFRKLSWCWCWQGRPVAVVAVTAVVLAAAIATIPSIKIESDPVGFLPEDHPTTRAYRSLAGKLGGFYTLELILIAPEAWYGPNVRPIVESVGDRLADSPIVSRVLSPVDVLSKLNHWQNEFDPAAYHPPATQGEAEALLGSANGAARRALSELVLDDDRTVRLSALVAEMEENQLLFLEREARQMVADLPGGWRGFVTGQVLQLVNAQQTLVSTQLRSLGIALCLVFGVMAFGLRSWSLTLTAVLPNLVPLVVTFSLMAILRIPLDAATVMVASIALGIAVDNTVHVLENVRRRREQGLPTGEAIEGTLGNIGPALAATTATACLGFLALCISDFMPIRAFGLLAAVSMTAAFVADVVLLPAILMWRQR